MGILAWGGGGFKEGDRLVVPAGSGLHTRKAECFREGRILARDRGFEEEYGRVVSGVGQRFTERPERTDDGLRMPRCGFGKVASRRRDRADHRDRTFFAAQRTVVAGPLVKRRQPRTKIRGVTFFGR